MHYLSYFCKKNDGKVVIQKKKSDICSVIILINNSKIIP